MPRKASLVASSPAPAVASRSLHHLRGVTAAGDVDDDVSASLGWRVMSRTVINRKSMGPITSL